MLTLPLYHTISKAASQLGLRAYVVGGVVRDYFLHRPCNDIDVVCVRTPETSVPESKEVSIGIALAQAVAAAINPDIKVNVFRTFGTASFIYHAADGSRMEVEFVGARKESYSRDSRNPVVENGTLQDDQNRRDFSVNALAFSLNEDDYGQLLDSFHGLQDLNDGILRTPLDPDITFSDDPLRMLRAIRFASQLGFTIAEDTFEAIARNAQRVSIVSKERITTELNKIVASPHPSLGIKLLQKSGLLPIFFPEFSALKGVQSVDGKAHKDNFYHTLEVLDHVAEKSDNLWLRWAAILHDIGKPATKRFDAVQGWTFHGHEVRGSKMVHKIFARLKQPQDEKMHYVEKLVLLHLRPIVLSEDIVTESAVRRLLFDAGNDIDDLMLLCEADITSKNEEKVRRHLRNFQIVKQKLVEVEERDSIRNFMPPVSGNDIMTCFNITPCREIGIIKDAIKDAVLDGVIPNQRAAAWQMMLQQGEALGLTPLYTEDPAPQSESRKLPSSAKAQGDASSDASK